MVTHCINAFLVKVLYGVPCKLLFFESGKSNINCFHLVADSVPSLFHYLASLLIRHCRVLAFDLCSCLSLVDTIWTDPFNCSPGFNVSFRLECFLSRPQLIWKRVDFLVCLLVLSIQCTRFYLKLTLLGCTQLFPLLHKDFLCNLSAVIEPDYFFSWGSLVLVLAQINCALRNAELLLLVQL